MDIMDPLMNPVTLGWLNNFWVLGFFFSLLIFVTSKKRGKQCPLGVVKMK